MYMYMCGMEGLFMYMLIVGYRTYMYKKAFMIDCRYMYIYMYIWIMAGNTIITNLSILIPH